VVDNGGGDGEYLAEHPMLVVKKAIEGLSDRQIQLALIQLKVGFETSGIQNDGIARLLYDKHILDSTEHSFAQMASIFYYEASRRFMKLYRKQK